LPLTLFPESNLALVVTPLFWRGAGGEATQHVLQNTSLPVSIYFKKPLAIDPLSRN